MADAKNKNPESRQRLGRGLAALLGDSRASAEINGRAAGAQQAPIEFIRPSPKNPRRVFAEEELEELAASIRERGIIQPLIVRSIPDTVDAYELVAGERRWRAAQRAGLHTVPIVALHLSDREALECSIVENVQRADLNALEEAAGYSRLAAEYGYNQTDIGRVVGKSRSHIANTLRLLGLPEHTRELLASGALTAGHARALLPLGDQDSIADRIVSQGLSVRDVEKLNGEDRRLGETAKIDERDPNTGDLENRLSLALGARVEVNSGKRFREIRIKMKSAEQLDYIIAKLLEFGH